jgi:hypothetical protein
LLVVVVWSVRSGNRANERCRVERHGPQRGASRQRKEARPSQPTGSDQVGLGTPVCAAGRLECQGARRLQGHRWLRGHGSNAGLWFRARRGTSSTTSHRSGRARWSRERESNPPREAYETSLIPDLPQRWGDRPDSNRLPPGPRPGVSTTSDLGHSRRGRSRTSGILRISSCRVSTGRSTVRASGPCACPRTDRSRVHARAGIHVRGEGTLVLRIEQAEPAAGIEPAASRVRAERPTVRTSPAWSVTEGVEPSRRRGAPTCCPLAPRPHQCPARPGPGGAFLGRRLRCPCSSGPGAACAGPRPGPTGRP